MSADFDREPTAHEAAGMAWWNSLTEQQRAEWLRRANSARPADAWEAYCADKSKKP